jgi:hypothetical protein
MRMLGHCDRSLSARQSFLDGFDVNSTAAPCTRCISRSAKGVSVAKLQEGDTVQAITILRPFAHAA